MQDQNNYVSPMADPLAPQPTAAPQPAPVTPPSTNGVPTSPVPLPNSNHHEIANIVKIVVIVVLSIISVTFIGLFIWKNAEWQEARTNVDGQIETAVTNAVSDNQTKMNNEFAEKEKYPYKTFSAPDDYGGLSFQYPKTWSVYIAKSAEENKGDFEAYLNPGVVNPVSATTINAVRVTIKTQTFEKTVAEYDKLVEKGQMSSSIETLNNDEYPEVKGDTYNLYKGELPSKLRGAVAIFKVRDKSIIIQTDAEAFLSKDNAGDVPADDPCPSQGDFMCPVLNTIHYNK